MTNYNLDYGQSYNIPLSFKNSAGTAIDIGSYTIYMMVKPYADYTANPTAVLSKTVTPGSSAASAAGSTNIFLTGSPDLLITPGEYVHQMSYDDGGSGLAVFDWGIFRVANTVRR